MAGTGRHRPLGRRSLDRRRLPGPLRAGERPPADPLTQERPTVPLVCGPRGTLEASTGQDGAHAIRSPARPGDRIREVRESRELSREELGVATGHSARRIGRIERGDPDARFHDLLLIARALDVPPADLVVERRLVHRPYTGCQPTRRPAGTEGGGRGIRPPLRAEGHAPDPPGRGPGRARDPTQWGP
ncbi:helix-turn-helix domain-containing protein [Streptomyces sp. CB02400]|uniref:helix-turn-helix domain-containing protein n=1 Tax=Streptomyces sp. CB02400 TaxID=1703944 RepID=UPI00093AA0AC